MPWWAKRRTSPFKTAKGALYQWDVAYFEHLTAEINALLPDSSNPAFTRAQEIIDKFHNRSEKLTRSDLLELEQLLLDLQSTDTLLQRAPTLRLRYSEVVGAAQYAAYKPVDISQCKPGDESIRLSLLSDLKNLVSGMHWRYVLLPMVDHLQTALTLNIIIWVLVYTVIWAVALSVTGSFGLPFLSMLATVVYAGIIGGYVSALRRVQSVRPENDSLLTIQALQNSSYFLYLSPLIGAIFAVVLLLIFLGGIVSGTVFPNFTPLPCADCSFPAHMKQWPLWLKLCPDSSAAYAKLFIWSFIAGFAERFVPDILDRVIQRGQSAGTASSPVPTGETRPPSTPSSRSGSSSERHESVAEPATNPAAPMPAEDPHNNPPTSTRAQGQSGQIGSTSAASGGHPVP